MKYARFPFRTFFLILFLSSLSFNFSNAQSGFGIRKINVWADFAFASPKKELRNFYSVGNAMQVYYGVDVPFAFLQYNKKSPIGLSFAGFLDHEKGNFSSSNYLSDGLDAKLTSFGIRFRPLYRGDLEVGQFKKRNGSETSEAMAELGRTMDFFTVLFSGLYFDYGMSSASLIEPPAPDVHRNAIVLGYGIAPMFKLNSKTSISIDLGIRNYNWTNASNTQSAIQSTHMGFGLGFKL